ncbi:MAG: type II toxin-antitoxin system VapC family toxin [Spirochaetaceae bacterium]
MYFIDTNICVFFLNGARPGVKERILSTPPNEIAVPSPVKAELLFGAYKSSKRNENIIKVEKFLEPFEIYPFDGPVSYTYADIRYKTEVKGTPVGPNDLWIAAIVMYHGGTLVSNNVREFRRIDNLNLEDWTV